MMARHPAVTVLSFVAVVAACSASSSSATDPSAPSGTSSGGPNDAGAAEAAPPFDGGATAPAWREMPSLPSPQQENAVVALNGKVFVIGGFGATPQATNAVAVFDPSTKEWSTAAPLPEPLHHLNAAVVGKRIFVVGALRGLSFEAVGTTLVYDADTNTWSPKRPMPAGTERGSSFVGAIGNVVYVAGGLRKGTSVADVSSYDTDKDEWSGPLPPLPAPLDHGMSAVFGDKLYAIGGRNGITGHVPTVNVFDPKAPASTAWTARAPMPTSRGGGMASIAKGVVVVAGGEGNTEDPNGMFRETEAYDPVADAWFSLPPMRTPRHGTGAATVNDVVIVPGGGIKQAFGQSAIVEALFF